jgi:hypothetical protein
MDVRGCAAGSSSLYDSIVRLSKQKAAAVLLSFVQCDIVLWCSGRQGLVNYMKKRIDGIGWVL